MSLWVLAMTDSQGKPFDAADIEHVLESDLPVWAKLAAIGPKHLTAKAELLVRLNFKQKGMVPTKTYNYKGNR